jgi:hypothetical protein
MLKHKALRNNYLSIQESGGRYQYSTFTGTTQVRYGRGNIRYLQYASTGVDIRAVIINTVNETSASTKHTKDVYY